MTPAPARLRAHYSRFLQADRVLLTGHSHQAWPDCAREALLESFDDAARHVDDKWSRAFEAADAVRDAVSARIGGRADHVALAPNTHELVARFLSAVSLPRRPKLVTTRGEFHTIDRQLRRLTEEGVEVVMVPALPVETLAARLADALDGDTAAVLVSAVLFETSARVPHLADLAARADALGVALLVDAYHAFNVAPFSRDEIPRAFVVGGGYKYAQWGEGVCFMTVPEGCDLRPVYTGWFAAFGSLADARDGEAVRYGNRPADRFAGSTYDPASHYRARAVARFFDAQGLTVPALRARSLQQTARLRDALTAAGREVLTPGDDAMRGGFVAVRVRDAATIVAAMRAEGVFVDARGEVLRFGPAPYVTDEEIDRGVEVFLRVAR